MGSTKLTVKSKGDFECNANSKQEGGFGSGKKNKNHSSSTTSTSNPRDAKGYVRNGGPIARKPL